MSRNILHEGEQADKSDAEREPLVRLVEALKPWLEQVVVISWAHRLDPRAQKLEICRVGLKGIFARGSSFMRSRVAN